MAATNKTWIGTTDDYTLASNWLPVSVRTSAYRWTASGSGTNEFYLELAAGGNPGLSEPTAVQANAVAQAAGTAGSLTAAQWDWADNDTLGFSTIYIRLTDGADPDSKDLHWVTFTQPPVATDHVRIPASSGAIAGVNKLSVSLGSFIVEDGHLATIGSATAPLRITTSRFEYAGEGVSYFDLGASAIGPRVTNTAVPSEGLRGLNLIGSALTTVVIEGGFVGIATKHGETSSASAVRIAGTSADVWLGAGLTLTTLSIYSGKCDARCAMTTLNVIGGELRTAEVGAITTANVRGGNLFPESSGTIGTLNLEGGSTDFLRSAVGRTVTTLKQNPGASLAYDPAVLTVTNRSAPDEAVRLVATAA